MHVSHPDASKSNPNYRIPMTLMLLLCLSIGSFYSIHSVNGGIESKPTFLCWKLCKYIWHKLILQEHMSPQRCKMAKQDVDRKNADRFSLVHVFDKKLELNSWWGASSAICATYASRHGYGYVYVHATPSERYGYNQGAEFGRNRTMHWARIPVLSWLLQRDPAVDWWFYLDMDAMINPFIMQYPIAWIFSAWHRDNGCIISKSESLERLIFFSNANMEPHMPCSGTFLASNASQNDLALWWEYSTSPYFDSHDKFDQHIVHELMFFRPDTFGFVVLDVRQFDFYRSSYLIHFSGSRTGSEVKFHHRILKFIRRSGALSSTEMANSIHKVKTQYTINCVIDLQSLQLRMPVCSASSDRS
jgi:hypothetical protein